MKKILFFIFCALPVFAGHPKVHRIDPFANPVILTTLEVLKMGDGDVVTMRGNIVRKVDDGTFILKDEDGAIAVEVDKAKLNDLGIKEKDVVVIVGEVQKKIQDKGRMKLKVQKIQKYVKPRS